MSGPLFGSQAWPSLTGAAPEVWAAGTRGANLTLGKAVLELLGDQLAAQLLSLCGRCLFQTITESLEVRGFGESVFVATGDIPDEWLRDGAVQLSLYLPRLASYPALRPVIEAAIRTQAYFILSDPWANSFRKAWIHPKDLPKFDRQIGRGGWVASRNFELDSGAYWLNLLWNYASTPGSLWGASAFLNSSLLHDAAALMVDTWTTEQRHETHSPYRYAELPREGLGPPTGYTGMIWSGFRPSDDPNVYSYNIPANMYAAGSLERLADLNDLVWQDPWLGAAARRLAAEVREGIDKYGVVTLPVWTPPATSSGHSHTNTAATAATNTATTTDGTTAATAASTATTATNHRALLDTTNGGGGGGGSPEPGAGSNGVTFETIYAYEVDGLGRSLSSTDDPNIPSLLAIPLLGYRHYDPTIYATTRRRILSKANKYYYAGTMISGLGSTHTPRGYVWSLSHCVQGLTTEDPAERAELFRQLLQMQGDNGLMHESNFVNSTGLLTRPLFQWANTMLVVFYEQTFGNSCSKVAEELRTSAIQQREKAETLLPRNRGPDLPAYYDRLEQGIAHV